MCSILDNRVFVWDRNVLPVPPNAMVNINVDGRTLVTEAGNVPLNEWKRANWYSVLNMNPNSNISEGGNNLWDGNGEPIIGEWVMLHEEPMEFMLRGTGRTGCGRCENGYLEVFSLDEIKPISLESLKKRRIVDMMADIMYEASPVDGMDYIGAAEELYDAGVRLEEMNND